MHDSLADFTTVYAENQTNGKGQFGNVWLSEKGKNLTFSVFLDTTFLKMEHQFYLSASVSIAIFNVLQRLTIPKLKIKWPNDILSESFKLGGILIENIVKTKTVHYSVIGIGLNVNQLEFSELLKATSLKNITGVHYNLEELMYLIVEEFKEQVARLKKEAYQNINEEYQLNLFRKNKPSTFKDAEGQFFLGFIKGVSNTGKLQILLEDEILKEFDLKTVSLMY